jgi:hypothetical protein
MVIDGYFRRVSEKENYMHLFARTVLRLTEKPFLMFKKEKEQSPF